MTTITTNKFAKYFSLAIGSFLLLLAFNSCSRKMNFETSSAVPAARGTVKVKKDNNNNYQVKVKLTNLAEVERLDKGNISYVVWMVTENDITKNIGQIRSASTMLSSKLTASFQAVSAFKPIRVFITPEENPEVQYPTQKEILTTSTF